MRYYSIIITDPKTKKVWAPETLNFSATTSFTSYFDNQNLPGALNIELDIPAAMYAAPMGGAYLSVWGVSLKDIGQQTNLNGFKIQVYAGMKKGLPLAKPEQAGLILQGYIWQAFGNWIGTDQTLNFVIYPTAFPTASDPSPTFQFTWKKGQKLAEAITNMLTAAYPNLKPPIVNINPNLVGTQDQSPGTYSSLVDFAQIVKAVSAQMIGGSYQGVDIFIQEDRFRVVDGTGTANPKQIAFEDMIGQPTWIEPTVVQVKLVMRSDIPLASYIQFPKSPVILNEQSVAPQINQYTTFQGPFFVRNLHHVGNFRQPDAGSWVTVVEAGAVNVKDQKQVA